LVVVAFWLAPAAVLVSVPAFPVFVQVMSVEVVVQAYWELAGSVWINSAATAPTAAQSTVRWVFLLEFTTAPLGHRLSPGDSLIVQANNLLKPNI
jgi:hypothetical protein